MLMMSTNVEINFNRCIEFYLRVRQFGETSIDSVVAFLGFLPANAATADFVVGSASVADKCFAAFAVLHVGPRARNTVVFVASGTTSLRDFAGELFTSDALNAEKAFLFTELFGQVSHDLAEISHVIVDLLFDFLEQVVEAIYASVTFEIPASQ